MRFSVNLLRGVVGKLWLDLRLDRQTGLYRLTSDDIPELNLSFKNPTDQAVKEIADAVTRWVAITPRLCERVLGEGPRDV